MLRLAKEDINKEIRLATTDWQELTLGFSQEEVKKIEDALR